MVNMKALAGACLLVLHVGRADEPRSIMAVTVPGQRYSGSIRVDFFGQAAMTDSLHLQNRGAESERSKSPWLAAGLSAVLPGAGEFYAESYWKAAVFFLADAALWTVAAVYDRKGNKQTDFFQAYADRNWSVVQYADFSWRKYLGSDPAYDWLIPNSAGLPPWQRVRWSVVNRMEVEIGRNRATYYSHTLPPYGDQQYYELIGKYHQFNQGWDDAPADYNYGDPVTAHLTYYAGERGKANDYYNTASTFVKIAVANHILSAIDAAWSASSFNRVRAQMGMQRVPDGYGGYANVPVATFTYTF